MNLAVSFGDVEITAPTLLGGDVKRADLAESSATIRLDTTEPLLNFIPLNEPVIVTHDGTRLFTGVPVAADVSGNVLTVRCSPAPRLSSEHGGGVARGNALSIVRLLLLDLGGQLADTDDANELCPAATRLVDWDLLMQEMEEASDFRSLLLAIRRRTLGKGLSGPEGRLLAGVMSLLVKEISGGGVEKDAAVETVTREQFKRAFSKIRGYTWRFRRLPDLYEVVVPLVRMSAPSTAIEIAGVRFSGTDNTADEYLDRKEAERFRNEWSSEVYARVSLAACDLWSAKIAGLQTIRQAMASVAFAYSFSSWHQKLADSNYAPVPYARPHGMPAMVGRLFRVTNLDSGDCWVGPISSEANPCNLENVRSRGQLLKQVEALDGNGELAQHLRRALDWRYKADLTSESVDAFLYMWISLEMLFQRANESSPDLIRRLPMTIVSVGQRAKPIRTELSKKWVPLRHEIVHRAIQQHPDIAEGLRRLHFFSDCAIGYALASVGRFATYGEWLDHLDCLGRTKPGYSRVVDSAG